MQTQLYKILTLFLILPMFMVANNNPNNKGKHTKKKVINKEFSVQANATLNVDNSYGNLDIITWNENKIAFEITITTNGNNEEKVIEKLNDITVAFENSPNLVSAKTIFKNNSRSWFSWGKSNNVSMKINYVIKMPITNNVDLSNDYGNITLDKLEGRAKINCDYGKITTKELMAENNSINFDYTQNSYFEYINSGEINADYSGFTVGKAKKLAIVADYTKSEIEIVEDIDYNCDYGSITIQKANNINGNGDYLTTRIGEVYKNVSLKADYGSIKIDQITANAKNINIASDYVGITIGYHADYHFNFKIDLEYASLREADGFEFNKKHSDSNDKYYEGFYGNNNTKNQIKIESDYGSVTFKKKQ
ncbi:MAG: hypothetical protein ACPG6B_05575 [Oceanihabitans sp.]